MLAVLLASSTPPALAETTLRRTAGSDRYATAAELSQLAFPDGAEVAFVATGTSFADALAGGPVATVHGGPTLLTDPDALPSVTATELRRLAPSRIVVLGGPAAVSAGVEAQLEPLAEEVFRIAGTSRYGTAASLATWIFEPGVTVAYVASGAGFADALAGGAAGGYHRGPVLLVERDAIPAVTLDALRTLAPDAIRVLGGSGAVAEAVVAELRALAPDVQRLAGADRYATAALVSADAFREADSVFVVTGASFADALAAGAAAGALDAPLLLSERDCLSAAAAGEIDRLDPDVVHLVGGEGALGPAVAALERCGGNEVQRATTDRPDDLATDRWQVHAMYVVPADGQDRELDLEGSIARSVAAFQTWLAEQSGGSRLAVDTFEGELDVTFHRLDVTDADMAANDPRIRDVLDALLAEAGFDSPRKLYALYYDGRSDYSCGGGAWPPQLVGRAAALYLHGEPPGAPPCDTNTLGASPTEPGYLDLGMLHEMFHTLGAVGTCAPNHTLAGHTSDAPTDLMYSGDEPWYASALDVGNDDYWGHGRSDCTDLARSVFLDPLPQAALPPPAWPGDG